MKSSRKLRHSIPGVGLISPPPHHDIYSIEDLAQLIYDLKNVNPQARIAVKLVAEVGVGTVAAGVAKAHADVVLITGDDGGTGASPLSSIKHAGLPWELGLAETQQVLVLNDLRSRIRVQTDGKLQTGRDVVIAALLGAEEFGFATAPLIAMGCIMMRKCHLNTCPVGIATQDPVLRKQFTGQPEHVINFFFFIAEADARAHGQARLPHRRRDGRPRRHARSAPGRSITGRPRASISRRSSTRPTVPVARGAPLHAGAGSWPRPGARSQADRAGRSRRSKRRTPVERKLRHPQRAPHGGRDAGRRDRAPLRLGRACRTTPSTSSSTAPPARASARSLANGVTLELEGDANDYVGKGLSGGRIIVYPPKTSSFLPEESILVGNVVLYGATSGEAFFNGIAGERFAVRNSGATAVVEGVGDHGCEYMTNGLVVVLGTTGRNFAAGMSGGIAYVFDDQGDFATRRCNKASVDLEPLVDRRRYRRGAQLCSSAIATSPAARAPRGFSSTGPMRSRSSSRSSRTNTSACSASRASKQSTRPPTTASPLVGGSRGGAAWVRSPDFWKSNASSPRAARSTSASTTGSRSIEPFPEEKQREQGARCMDCGVPFCHTGCPVNNLIPDWNDLVYSDRWESAIRRLHATNNFPEFTGRICPAPCEAACVLGINRAAGHHQADREAASSSAPGTKAGSIPSRREHDTGKRVAVVGTGPAGLAAAQQLRRAGHSVTVFEKDDRIGGLLRYGIPELQAGEARHRSPPRADARRRCRRSSPTRTSA